MNSQVRIFVPFNQDYGLNWAENIMGRIIKPIVSKYQDQLKWFWFSRYSGSLQASNEDENCIVEEIKEKYRKLNVIDDSRSLRFRYCISDSFYNGFEKEVRKIIVTENGFISDFRPYDMLNDVGNERHLGGDRNINRRRNRAKLITKFYYSTAKLTLDLLEKTSSKQYNMEINNAIDIGESESSFAVPHHLFCNMTGIPLHVFLRLLIETKNVYAETRTMSWDEEPSWAGYPTIEELKIPVDKKIKVLIKF